VSVEQADQAWQREGARPLGVEDERRRAARLPGDVAMK
jgi:hypothetical protein